MHKHTHIQILTKCTPECKSGAQHTISITGSSCIGLHCSSHIKHVPASGPWHLLFLLVYPWSRYPHSFSLSFGALFKHHLFREYFLNLPVLFSSFYPAFFCKALVTTWHRGMFICPLSAPLAECKLHNSRILVWFLVFCSVFFFFCLLLYLLVPRTVSGTL